MRRLLGAQELLGPAALVIPVALVGTVVSTSNASYFIDALVKVAIVVALYLFIGNSGVLSFGHISFVALGAWTPGVLSVPAAEKPAIMPTSPISFATARPATSPPCSSPPSSAGSARSWSACR